MRIVKILIFLYKKDWGLLKIKKFNGSITENNRRENRKMKKNKQIINKKI